MNLSANFIKFMNLFRKLVFLAIQTEKFRSKIIIDRGITLASTFHYLIFRLRAAKGSLISLYFCCRLLVGRATLCYFGANDIK